MANLDTIKTESELPSPKKKPSKARSVWGILFRLLWITVFVLVIGVSSQIIYDYTRYDNFYVSGDSMYPTLNKDATCSFREGEINDGTWGNFDADGTYVCDYGLSDSSDGFQDKLERFDVVVAHYDDDYDPSIGGFTGKAVIKRLIALPGESVYFSVNGTLFVKEAGASDYKEVPQPAAIVNDENSAGEPTIGLTASAEAVSALRGSFYGSESDPVTLLDDEYFLVGDNRRIGKSDDSRKYGPLGIGRRSDPSLPSGRDLIVAKAIAITAKRRVVMKGGEAIKNTWVFGSAAMPWAIQYLGPDGEAGATVSIGGATGDPSLFRHSRRRLWPN
jgi:signal peptidase I